MKSTYKHPFKNMHDAYMAYTGFCVAQGEVPDTYEDFAAYTISLGVTFPDDNEQAKRDQDN